MTVVTRKLTTMRRVFHEGGVHGLFLLLMLKAAPFLQALDRRHLRKAFEVWCEQEHWLFGLLVVLKGNVVRVDSCSFVVRHPAIRTATKSLFLLGGYERAEREMLKQYLDPSGPVIELGGSVGVVACVTNKLLDDPRRHVVVEANPELVDVLTANRDRNGCAFSVMNGALAYSDGSARFYLDTDDFLASSVQVKTGRSIDVPVLTLRELVERFGFDSCSLVCDIEGGEVELVLHEPETLQNHVATMIVEIHGWRVGHEKGVETITTLARMGFRCLHEKDGTYVFRNERLRAGAEAAIA